MEVEDSPTIVTEMAAKKSSGLQSRLFESGLPTGDAPLAERMRPRTLEELFGQERALRGLRFLSDPDPKRSVPSLLLWGPPGVGKTTIAKLLAKSVEAHFISFSAVLGSIADLRVAIEEARTIRETRGSRTILFVDEIHRFNRAQQDAFLPHVESGLVVLVGATTENPSFSVNPALLSRCQTVRLQPLDDESLVRLLDSALVDRARGLGEMGITAEKDALAAIADRAAGDARRALTTLELAANEIVARKESVLTLDRLREIRPEESIRHDRSGDQHYDVVSAFIKSMRGSDPDAAVYYMMRMLEGGEDPLFVLRRMLIFASEDIGLADSRALMVVTAADHTVQRVGLPEGFYALSHAACYLACAPKSNAAGMAWHKGKALVEKFGALEVPFKLRNAPTKLMANEGFGANYKYAHDHGGIVMGETYLPDRIASERLYEPTERGEEAKIKPRIDALRSSRKD